MIILHADTSKTKRCGKTTMISLPNVLKVEVFFPVLKKLAVFLYVQELPYKPARFLSPSHRHI